MSKYNLVIPMAGLGSRFSKAGYETPKPLLPIRGHRMFEIVIANLTTSDVNQVSLIAPAHFELAPEVAHFSQVTGIPIRLFEIDFLTDGPVSSAMIAAKELDFDLPIIIANSDQYLDFNVNQWINTAIDSNVDGSILCMRDSHPKWSYVEVNERGEIARVVEKQVVSSLATCGVYFFSSTAEFIRAAECQREGDERVNNEFYVAPLYNYLISQGKRLSYLDMGPISEVMFGLGTPEDYELFIQSPIAFKIDQMFKDLIL
jgi:NDP-sugar pyrophosphorylase family protein